MTLALQDPPTVEYGHVEPIIVHFDELDMMGILHNARYAVLLERALNPYWTERGHSSYRDQPVSPDAFHVVREFTITYHRPIRGTGTVLVHFWMNQVGATSAEYGFRFLSADGETVHAEGRRVIVRLDPATMRPTKWSDSAREVAKSLLRPGNVIGQREKNDRRTAAHSASSTPE